MIDLVNLSLLRAEHISREALVLDTMSLDFLERVLAAYQTYLTLGAGRAKAEFNSIRL